MNILFLCHRIPYPPNKGDKIRSFNVLRYLSQRHEVYLACLADDKKDLKYRSNLTEFCKQAEVAFINKFWAHFKMLWCLLRGRPLTLGYFYSKKLKNTIDNWLEEVDFDRIYVFSSGVAQYVLNNPKTEGIRKIMDFVDMDSDKWLQNARQALFPVSLLYRIEGRRMRVYEAQIAVHFQHSIVITQNEYKLFQTITNGREAVVVPNGIDHAYFSPNGARKTPEEPTIVFTGAMDYFANTDGVLYFYKEIFPFIRTQIKGVKFCIVGSNPTKAIQRLKQDKDIVVTGFVEDIRSYLQKAAVCVVPLRIARGIQNKILEAMSMKLPVVTTSKTARNLAVRPGTDIFVEDEPKRFAEKVVELLQNAALRQRVGEEARKTVERNYDWNKNFEKIDALLIQ